MTYTRITTAGAGTMGSQVAWQMAFHGKQVTVYDAIPAGLEKGKAFHREYAEHFLKKRGATQRAGRRHVRSHHIHDRSGRGGARCRSDQRVRAGDDGDQGILLARRVPARPGTHRVHHQHIHADAERPGRLRRPAAEVPGLALCHRRLGLQHRRGHGASRHRPVRVRDPAEVRRGNRPGAHPHSQGAERLHHQQPARALVHRRAGPAGARRERLREHRPNLDDHHAEPAWARAE